MKQVFLALALCAAAAPSASAQTKGRVSVGGSVTYNHTTDSDAKPVLTGGPLIRLNPRPGWGAAAALNWLTSDLRSPSGADDFANVRARPLMGGIAYSVAKGNLLTSFSVVAGPSFNRARFDEKFTAGQGVAIDADTSFAFRPGIGLTYTVAPRVTILGFGGYLVNRPNVTFRDASGNEFRDRWKTDAIVLSVGAAYSIF